MSSTPNNASATGPSSPPLPPPQTPSSYLSYPVSHVVSGLYRRLTEPSPNRSGMPRLQTRASDQDSANDMPNGVYTPPHRTASPFQPPPLTPLALSGSTSSTILSRAVAEEIRLLLPPRLQLAEQWSLAYSLEQDGVSLGTLYNQCASPKIPRDASFILVVQDGAGGVCFSILPPSLFYSFTKGIRPDFWRLPNLSASYHFLLLRHRRMLPLARVHPSFYFSPLKSPTSTLGARYRKHGPEYHDREPNNQSPIFITPFTIVCSKRR